MKTVVTVFLDNSSIYTGRNSPLGYLPNMVCRVQDLRHFCHYYNFFGCMILYHREVFMRARERQEDGGYHLDTLVLRNVTFLEDQNSGCLHILGPSPSIPLCQGTTGSYSTPEEQVCNNSICISFSKRKCQYW